jgi:hypothetical protein
MKWQRSGWLPPPTASHLWPRSSSWKVCLPGSADSTECSAHAHLVCRSRCSAARTLGAIGCASNAPGGASRMRQALAPSTARPCECTGACKLGLALRSLYHHIGCLQSIMLQHCCQANAVLWPDHRRCLMLPCVAACTLTHCSPCRDCRWGIGCLDCTATACTRTDPVFASGR